MLFCLWNHATYLRCFLAWTCKLTPNFFMMTSSNGNIFRVTGPLCGEFIGPGEFPTQRPVTRSFDVFFDLRLSKQPWGWWFETPSWPLWRHCNVQRLPCGDSSCCNKFLSLYVKAKHYWSSSLSISFPLFLPLSYHFVLGVCCICYKSTSLRWKQDAD